MTRVILLVEYNESDEKLTLLAFKGCGVPHGIVVQRDGAAALDWLASAPALPAVVLLDLKLPLIGGLEVIRRLRSDPRTKLLPIVVLSSSIQEDDIATSYSLGANAYLRKPVDFVEFGESVKTLSRFWLVLNEVPPCAAGRP
ncbi:response regulator [soil metagenome]